LFKWVDEDVSTWETRHSFERWGGVDYDSPSGLSREELFARFDELDALASESVSQKATTKKRKKN
jgi:hypothetical protein